MALSVLFDLSSVNGSILLYLFLHQCQTGIIKQKIFSDIGTISEELSNLLSFEVGLDPYRTFFFVVAVFL